MQHQKFTLALATVEDVITAQRNLAAAQSHVVIARAIYAKTLIQYELATDTLLDRHNIVLFEAIDGDVHRVPNIPGTPELANEQWRSQQGPSIDSRIICQFPFAPQPRPVSLSLR
jgi:hypothetical protein